MLNVSMYRSKGDKLNNNHYLFYLIKENLREIQLIKRKNFTIKMDIFNIKYKKPKYSSQKCILKTKTYSISLYTPIEIKYKEKKINPCDSK